MNTPWSAILLALLCAVSASRGQPAFVSPDPRPIGDKTLVAWCQPDQAAYLQGGGGVLTVQEGGQFDSIVLGELRSGVWMGGSENFNRTQGDQSLWPETNDSGAMVQIALVHEGSNVRIYRAGNLYAEYTVPLPASYGAGAEFLIGWRHFGAGPGSFFKGEVDEARVYDRALTADELSALTPGAAGSSAPLAMWTFENGSLADSTGRFSDGQLRGQAAIRNGRLHLGGAGDYFAVKPASADFEPTLHFRPVGGAAGDAIPFYHKGQYHVFYLRDNEWAHLVSRDSVNWSELPMAIKVDHSNLTGPEAEAAWTGSIVRKDGDFHFFYTGKNLRDPAGDQKVMVATSRDLVTWTKQPQRTFYADGAIYWSKPVNGAIDQVRYHHQAFRDPAVVWNEAAGEWWMVLHAIVADGSAPAMGLYASTDLLTWTPRQPLLTYPMALSGDCPDIFELGGDWYIINGNYEYTWAPEADGPWSQNFAAYDNGDLRVAKTMFDGQRRLLVGWVGDYAGETDAGEPQWGGHLSMTRELYAPAPGQLGQRPVAEVVSAFSSQVAAWPDGVPTGQALSLPRDFMLHATLTDASPDARAEVIFRRPDNAASGGYHLRVNFATREVELGGEHKQFRRVCEFDPAQPLEVRLFAIGTVIECFINDRYAFTMRAYDYHGAQMIVRAEQGSFQVQDSAVFVQGGPAPAAPEPPDLALMAASGLLRWIWHKEPGESATTAAPAGKVRLRRSFDLSADNMPDWAEFVFAVDDSAEVFVNGHRLGLFHGWNPPTSLDIRPWLRPGLNVIAVEAENTTPSPAGFVGLVELEGYPPVMFDGSTRSSLVSAGATTWADPAFDDSGWAGATVLVPADLGPWGRISGPLPENPTQQRIPENFPTFAVPGFETEMDRMRQILFGHYRMDLSKLPTFNLQWLAPAAIWAGLDARPADSWTRASLRARLLSMRVMPDGYVSCHQHEGLGHSEGWPFPIYTQSGGAGWMFSTAGLLYGPELGVFPATSVADWTFRRATAASLDVTGGLRLELTGDDAAMTSPTINVDPQAATWVRIKLIPGTTPLRPYVQWRTAAAGFSESRKVAFEIPADATPGVPIDVDVPIHQLALGGDNITRLRVGFGNTGSGEVTILRVFTAVDTRHNVNNANFVLAAATYFNWTGDVDFLRDYIGTLRRIFRYSVEEFGVRTHGVVSTPWAGKDGRSGLTIGPGGSKTINYGLGVGNNYWDLLPFGGKDAYATVYHFAATRAMEQLEAAIAARPEWNIPAPAADYGAARLNADLELIRGASAQTFWKADKGRLGAAVDSTGKLWDYGFTFLNNEAMYYGLTTPAQERQIVDWLSGTRSIAGETATGSDLYRWRFGPRATTVRNVDYYNHAWTGPETLPFGGQLQDGGAVFGFSFHDLMGRLRVNGPDDAWAQLKEILAWYGEVQAAGGYRKYYTPETADQRGTLQGGGTAGGLGMDAEFYETLLVPLVMTEGFLGLSVSPERVRFAPQLPQEWPSLEVGRIQYRDWMLRAKATPYEFELDLEAGGTAGPIEVELGAGRWDVQVLDAQNQVLATAAAGEQEGTTLTIDDPASKRLVATRAPELNVWLLAVSGDWNTATNWHLGVVPGGTYAPLLNNGGTAYLATNAPVLSGAAFIGQGAGDGTLEIRSGGSLALGQLLLGRDSGRTGTLVVDGGTLAVAEVLHVGDGGDGTGGYGNVQVVSGLLDAGTAGIRLGGNGGAGVTGSFVLSGGALQAADLVVRAGSSFSDRGGTIDVAATITNHGTWTLDPPTALTRSYNLAGTGAVTKSGTGTMTLTGTNAGTGVTIVESGRLVIDGNHSAATGDVIVRSGAALGGRGTLGGNLVLEAGARWVLATQSALTVTGTVSGGFTLAQVEGLDAGSPVGRYPLINGTVDPSQFSPVGPAAAQDIGGGHLAWFEAGGGSLTLVVASATPSFGGWLQQNGLQGPAADPLASPAGDGIVNLLKYAFNLDPLRHEGNGQYPGEFRGLPYLESAAAGDLHLIYYRDPAKTDIRVTPVWRRDLNDLSGWSEIDVNNRQLLGTQDGIEQWRARLPIEGNQGFMSIQVEIE